MLILSGVNLIPFINRFVTVLKEYNNETQNRNIHFCSLWLGPLVWKWVGLQCRNPPSLFRCCMITKVAQRWHSDARKSRSLYNCKEKPRIYFPLMQFTQCGTNNSQFWVRIFYIFIILYYMELISIWNKIVQWFTILQIKCKYNFCIYSNSNT